MMMIWWHKADHFVYLPTVMLWCPLSSTKWLVYVPFSNCGWKLLSIFMTRSVFVHPKVNIPSLSAHCLLISSLSTLSSAASSPLSSEWSGPRLRAGVEQCWARSHNPYYLHPFKDLFIRCYLTRAAFSVSWSDVGLSFPVSRSCGVWLQGRDVYVRKTIIYVTYKCWDVRFLMLDILAHVSCVFILFREKERRPQWSFAVEVKEDL